MSKYTNIFGIDISKGTFDVVNLKGNHLQFGNDKKGFNKFRKEIPEGSLCIMEVTGIYHLQLANFLFEKGIDVSVVNSLRIKRFIQMNLRRNKTDKADAKMIALYGKTQEVDLWEPSDKSIEESKDIYQTMEHYINIRASLKNKLDGMKSKKAGNFLIKNIIKQIDLITVAIEELQEKLNELVKDYDAKLLTNIKTITGIGERTATLLIIVSNGFRDFESAKQLSSYFGLAPTETSSGTSINGSRKISKMGNPLVRKKIYMCSLQASRHNKACVDLYQRLIAKGKSKKTSSNCSSKQITENCICYCKIRFNI